MGEVRRMRLKPEDAFVIIATSGLWSRIEPEEAVRLVSENMHRVADDAAAALANEAAKRRRDSMTNRENYRDAGPDDITVVVIYLSGESYVSNEGGSSDDEVADGN